MALDRSPESTRQICFIPNISALGLENIAKHEKMLLDFATQEIKKIKGIKIIGEAQNKTSVLAFTLEGAHPHDLGTLLDRQGVAVRTGHHCTQPLMNRMKINATTRASFSLYNTKEEVEIFIKGLQKAIEFL